MLKERKCLTCKEKFIPKSEKNIFHSRQCFKRYYYHRKKAEELANLKFPTFKCPSCLNEVTLDFDPIKKPENWHQFICPYCSVLMINVSEKISAKDMSIS